uniref:Uncharacterized protein n=1 Tax=Arundo donax TaxID=35708 RepID=A0A0A8XX41_ARUDO
MEKAAAVVAVKQGASGPRKKPSIAGAGWSPRRRRRKCGSEAIRSHGLQTRVARRRLDKLSCGRRRRISAMTSSGRDGSAIGLAARVWEGRGRGR